MKTVVFSLDSKAVVSDYADHRWTHLERFIIEMIYYIIHRMLAY